jgi:hypothetical protein
VTVEVLASDMCRPAIPPNDYVHVDLRQNPKYPISKPHFANVSLANGSTRAKVCIAANEERSSRTEVLTVVKSEAKNVLEGEGRRLAHCSWSVPDPPVFPLLCLLGLTTIAKPAHRRHILTPLPSHRMIYPTM